MKFLRRRWLFGLVMVAVALAGLALVRWRARDDDLAWQRIQAEGRFVIATDASYPPFSAVDANGNLFGFDVDLGDELGRRWGVAAAYENITYDALLGALVVGRDDAVISAFVAQPERTREVAYTRSYFVGGTVAVIRRDSGQPISGDPQAWAMGKTLAVEYGAGGDALARQWARRVVGVVVLPKPAPGEALLAVENGEADAALVDIVSAYDFLLGHPALMLAGPSLEPQPYVIAVSVKSRTLLAALESALADMEADGTLPALRVKWFGEAAR